MESQQDDVSQPLVADPVEAEEQVEEQEEYNRDLVVMMPAYVVDSMNYSEMDMVQVLQFWDAKHTRTGFDPAPILKRLVELLEEDKEIFMRRDPDPFDDRHPHRTDHNSQFGLLLKLLFRKESFMNKLVRSYLRENYFTRQSIHKSSLEVNILACRLILVLLPGLDTANVFQEDHNNVLNRLYTWSEDSAEPLQSYATGVLAAAMDSTDVSVTFRRSNHRIIPLMIKRCRWLRSAQKCERETPPPFQLKLAKKNSKDKVSKVTNNKFPPWLVKIAAEWPHSQDEGAAALTPTRNSRNNNTERVPNHFSIPGNPDGARLFNRFYIPIHPPTTVMSQMLTLRFLMGTGECKEFLGLVFEHNVIQLIFDYIENLDGRDTCLAFEALKYLSSLLCHKKFALEFIARNGLEHLLKVPCPSIASTGVSIAFYYLAFCEESMERICAMPRDIITQLVNYALWLLERSYDSGKCHATMFFGLSFQFKVILDEFDAQDGLRKLYNVISILKILNPSSNEEDDFDNEDIESAARQLVRHVCVALKRYMESHLYFKYNEIMRQQCPTSIEFAQNVLRAAKPKNEPTNQQIRALQEITAVNTYWKPVNELLQLGGITMLLKVVAFSYEWNNIARFETVRCALDVLAICCVIPKVRLAFCDRLDLPEGVTYNTGICSLLGAAAGDVTTGADVQRSALAVLCHCVCAPYNKQEAKGKKIKRCQVSSDDIMEKVWACVCSNNGIIILISLMQIKAPITDADSIRGFACRALAGLVRSERVRQIVCKLPLYSSGQIQTLMRDPILQEKHAEHVIFQKYALELLECLSGKTKPIQNQLESSLSIIHKANVVAQTKIQYSDRQLYQLIYNHLASKGMTQTAEMLQKETGMELRSTQPPTATAALLGKKELQIHTMDQTSTNNVAKVSETTTSNSSTSKEKQQTISNFVNTIKLVKRSPRTSNIITRSYANRPLQKRITNGYEGTMEENDSPGCSNSSSSNISLDHIVTEYLSNQHALCNNPMTTCPQFDLFTPHKCPESKPNRVRHSDMNLVTRLFKAQAGHNTSRYDRRFVHSNYAIWRRMCSSDYPDVHFSCCHIVPSTSLLLVGTQQGDAKAFNMNDCTEQFSSKCHSYLIDSITSNREGNLVLTSCAGFVLSAIEQQKFVPKLRYDRELYCEFNNIAQDKILGTQHDATNIYDIATGNKLSTFTPTLANQYTKNRATFCPTDELILSDGVLWDVRSGREIHKFDKLNQALSGIFHPNGLEIIANTEVWDLRTFRLLRTVPVLDQCFFKFSPMKVIYGIRLDAENRSDFDEPTNYETSFKVLDIYDYSSIATIEVKRNIYDLSVNGNGSLIAIVENQPGYDTKHETFVNIYSVGARKEQKIEGMRGGELGTSVFDGNVDTSARDTDNIIDLSPFFNTPDVRSVSGSGLAGNRTTNNRSASRVVTDGFLGLFTPSTLRYRL